MGSRERIVLRTKRIMRHMTPKHIVKSRMTRRLMRDFADKVGMVFFGYVNQNDDEHRLVRGHTVSATHTDNNYSIGTLRGYDVMMVSRNDVITTRHRKQQRCHWLICAVDLHTRIDLPHLYVGHAAREEAFLASYEQLHRLNMGMYAAYPPQFLSEYAVYGVPGDGIEIEQTITPEIALVISAHFSDASIEIEHNTIYLYIESQHPTEVLLEKMLSNALWLAESIDTAYPPEASQKSTEV